MIDARKPGDAGIWETEEVALMETLSEELGVALEGARLHEDTQRRAARDRLMSDIVSRMREPLNMGAVLQTATREIGESLGLHTVTIQLEADDDSASESQDRERQRKSVV